MTWQITGMGNQPDFMKGMEAGALFCVNLSLGAYFASGTFHDMAKLFPYSPYFSVISTSLSMYG